MARAMNCLQAAEKARLIFWLKEHAGDERTYEAIATQASSELGFAVTPSNVQGWWCAVNGPRRTYPVTGRQMARLAELEEALLALSRRVEVLEAGVA